MEQKIIKSRETDELTLKIKTTPEFRPSKPRVDGRGMTKAVVMYAEIGTMGGVDTGIVDDRGRAIKATIKLYASEPIKSPRATVGSLQIA